MSAVFSPCGLYRYRLEREVQPAGIVIAFYGVNSSTAGEEENDHTVTKLIEFTRRAGGRKFIIGNPFAFRTPNVEDLSCAADPVGPRNAKHLDQIIADADMHVPCWGSRSKLPRGLRFHLDFLADKLHTSGKPVRIFGETLDGDPRHPLMLPYSTELVEWPELGSYI